MFANGVALLSMSPINLTLLALFALGCMVLLIAFLIIRDAPARARMTKYVIQLKIEVKAVDDSFMSQVVLPVSLSYRVPQGAGYTPEQIGNYLMSKVRQTAARTCLKQLHDNRAFLEMQTLKYLRRRFKEERYQFEALVIMDPEPSDEIKRAFLKQRAKPPKETMSKVTARKRASYQRKPPSEAVHQITKSA